MGCYNIYIGISIGITLLALTAGDHYYHRPFSIKHISQFPFLSHLSSVNQSALCVAVGGTCSTLGTCFPHKQLFCNTSSICCGAAFLGFGLLGHHGGHHGGHHRGHHGGHYGGHYGGGHHHGGHHGGHYGGGHHGGHQGGGFEHHGVGGYAGLADYGGAHELAEGFGSIHPSGTQYQVWKKKRKKR